MILSIHQPSYFPWLGLLDKIAKTDVYMVMDEVQLSDSAFQNRNIFLTNEGKVKYLTIGYNKKDYLNRKFLDLEIVQLDWQEKHKNTIRAYYGKHPFFKEVFPQIESIFQKSYTKLIDPVVDSMRICMELLNIQTEIIFQSKLAYNRESKKSDLVLELVKAAGASIYLAGTGSKDYMQLEDFVHAGINVPFNHFEHPDYPQKGCEKFKAGVSSLDLLFNVGIDQARQIIHTSVEKTKVLTLGSYSHEAMA